MKLFDRIAGRSRMKATVAVPADMTGAFVLLEKKPTGEPLMTQLEPLDRFDIAGTFGFAGARVFVSELSGSASWQDARVGRLAISLKPPGAFVGNPVTEWEDAPSWWALPPGRQLLDPMPQFLIFSTILKIMVWQAVGTPVDVDILTDEDMDPQDRFFLSGLCDRTLDVRVQDYQTKEILPVTLNGFE